MPATPEHKADMSALAQERKRAGKPSWKHKLNLANVFRNESMTFEERRDAIVRQIRATAWFKSKDASSAGFDEFVLIVEELAEAPDQEAFNNVWDAIYDEADYDRVWIITR
jgi:hypothetical protein